MNDLLLVIALLLLACVALLIVLLVRQSSALHREEESRLRQERGLENLGNQLLDELDAQRDQTMDSLYQGNQHLMATLSQMGQSQSTLLENMLASVYRGLGEMQTVASGVGDLKKVMTNVKTRGIWGEMQLGNLIRQTLAPDQYAENIEVVPGSRERVEFAIRLPDQNGLSCRSPGNREIFFCCMTVHVKRLHFSARFQAPCCAGSATENTVPSPGLDRTLIFPSWATTMIRAMLSPRPWPPLSDFRALSLR